MKSAAKVTRKQRRKPSKKGRPISVKREPAKTRETILHCAALAFAKAGFFGTSLSEILEQAGVNKRMIYHYYGSKEGLYRAVHIQQWQGLETWFAERLSQSSQGGAFQLESEALLKEALTIFHEFIARNQIFVRLLMWDGLEGGVVSRSIWRDIRGPLYERMELLVLAAQAHHLLSKDFKAGHLIVSFMGAISFYFAYANSLEDIFHKPALGPELLEERKEQVWLLFQKVLEKPAPTKGL